MYKPRLTYFAPYGADDKFGGAARLNNMLNILEQLGAKIQLISYAPRDKFGIEHKHLSDHLNTNTIHVSQSSPKFFKAFAIIPILVWGSRHVKGSNIIFAHSPDTICGFSAAILAKIFNKPLIIDYMDVKDTDTPEFIYKYILRNCDVVLAISHFLMTEAQKLGCGRVKFVPAFVDTTVFQKDLIAREETRKRMGIKNDEIVIGYTGSFWRIEGVSILINAITNIVNNHKHVKLVLIGGGNMPDLANVPELVKGLEGNVVLIPPQPHESIPKYLSAFDVACSPKIDCEINRAANPMKVVEYLSMGLPTVCSAVGGVSDTIEDGVDGFLVTPGDVKNLEETLEWIILNPKRSKEIGENGRKKVIEKYSCDAIRDAIKQSIEAII